MSEVRARAEERRKKILARSNSKVSAVGDDVVAPVVGETENLSEEKEVKTPERPLASRRQYVRALSEKAMSVKDIQDEDVKEVDVISPVKVNDSDDPEVESIDMVLQRSQNSTNSLVGDSVKTTPKKEFVYSNKTVKEIEAEVAMNTKKYDESVMKKEVNPNAEKKLRPKAPPKSNLDPSSIMRLIRLLLIVALGVGLAFQTVMTSRAAEEQHRVALATISHSAVIDSQFYAPIESADDEFAAEVSSSSFSSSAHASSSQFNELPVIVDPSSSMGRSWLGWFVWKLRSQIECTLSAVGLVWWASRSLSPMVALRFKNSPSGGAGSSYMSMALNLWQTGFEGIFEHAYSLMGEIALYVAVLVTAVVGFTVLYSGAEELTQQQVVEVVTAAIVNSADGVTGEL